MLKKRKKLKNNLEKLFNKLGIKRGNKIILHSNAAGLFQYINKKDSLDIFYKSLIRKLGPKGVLAIPTYNYDFARGVTFNKNKSSSQVGYFTNYMLKKKPSTRTNDPIFSHLIFGKNIKQFKNANNLEVFGKESIFGLFEKFNFQILCFCCSPSSITFIHYIENLMDVKYRFKKKFTGKIKNANGIKKISILYNVGKKNINYRIKDKNLMPLIDNINFVEAKFGRFICYSVKAKHLSKIIKKKISLNQNFLIR